MTLDQILEHLGHNPDTITIIEHKILEDLFNHMADTLNSMPLCECVHWARAGVMIDNEFKVYAGHHPACKNFRKN